MQQSMLGTGNNVEVKSAQQQAALQEKEHCPPDSAEIWDPSAFDSAPL